MKYYLYEVTKTFAWGRDISYRILSFDQKQVDTLLKEEFEYLVKHILGIDTYEWSDKWRGIAINQVKELNEKSLKAVEQYIEEIDEEIKTFKRNKQLELDRLYDRHKSMQELLDKHAGV